MLLGEIMADNVNVNVNVDDGGSTKKLIKSANELRTSYEGAARAASSVKANAPAPGGTSGSRRAAEMSETDYGRARGAAGATGASARDFANQAQGLGGIVRLYATYAANVFAVTAAFRALSNAMDTANMVQGLNILGAASGRSLGSLSQRLVEVTDGALSMRDAMEATAKGSAAGLTNQQLERMAKVAKSSSLALGVSMPDAMNRLSRGISKLEPELLDELGIFTKIGPATAAYAASLGKTESQLSDFEKRQAFANAVLKEGEQKFAEIADQIAANPYTKLEASLKNTAQSGLDLVNKVLGPIVNLLSETPGALIGVLALLGSTLIKQAIPAIGQYKERLKQTAEDSANIARKRLGDMAGAEKQLTRLITMEAESRATKELNIFEQNEQKYLELKQAGVARQNKALKSILREKDISEIDRTQIDAAQRDLDNYTRNQSKKKKVMSETVKAQIAAEQELINSVRATVDAEEAARQAYKNAEIEATKKIKNSKAYLDAIQEIDGFERKARANSIASNAAYNASLFGTINAWKLMNLELQAVKGSTDFLERGWIRVKSAVAIATGAVTALGAALNRAIMVVTTIITVFEILSSIYSTNSKQAAEFSSAVDQANESVLNSDRTIASFAKKMGGLSQSTIEGAVAIGNAFSEIEGSAEKMVITFEASIKKMSRLDRGIDMFLDMFNFGSADKLAKSLTDQIGSAMQLLQSAGLAEKYGKEFSDILGVSVYSKNLEDTLEQLAKTSPQKLTEFIKKMAEAKREVVDTASAFDRLKTSSDTALKLYKDLLVSFASKDPMFMLGESLANFGESIAVAMAKGEDGILALFDMLAKSPDKLVLMGEDFVATFIELSPEIQKAMPIIAKYNKQIQDLGLEYNKVTEEINNYKNQLEALPAPKKAEGIMTRQDDVAANRAYGITERLKKAGAEQTRILNQQFQVIEASTNVLAPDRIERAGKATNAAVIAIAEKSWDFISKAYQKAVAEANASFLRTLASIAAGPVTKVELEYKAATSMIAAQIAQVTASRDQIISNDSLTSSINALNTTIMEANALAKGDKAGAAKIAQAGQTETDFAAILSSPGARKRMQTPTSSTAKDIVDDYNAALVASGQLALSDDKRRIIQQKIEAVVARTMGFNATLVGLSQQQKNEDLKRLQGTINGENQLSKAQEDSRAATQKALSDQKLAYEAILGTQSATTIDLEREASLRELNKKSTDEQNAIGAQIRDQQIVINNLRAQGTKDSIALADTAEREKNTYVELLRQAQERQGIEQKTVEIRSNARKLELQVLDIQRQGEVAAAKRATSFAQDQAALEVAASRFDLEKQIFALDERYIANRQFAQDSEKVSLDYARQRTEAEKAFGLLVETNNAKKAAAPGADFTQLNAEQDRQKALLDEKIKQLDVERNKQLEILDIIKQKTIEEAKYNEQIKQIDTVSSSLVKIFENTGQKSTEFGQKLGEAFATIGKETLDYTKVLAGNQKAIDENKNKISGYLELGAEAPQELYDENKRLQSKALKDELSHNAKIISATKGIFKEKTAAFKVLAAVEKAHHLFSLALNAKELFMKLTATTAVTGAKVAGESTQTAAEGAGFFARLPVYIASIYAKTFGQLGIFGPPVATALVAAMLAAIGGGGGGKSVPGITAEQRQETQGSAMGYDAQGNLVQTRRGVFGDTSAKSESIAKSLEVIRDNSVKGLTYNNSMLKALEKIRDSLDTTAKQLFRLPGLKAGTVTGAQEGTSKSGIKGLFGKETTTEIIDSGIKLAGTFGDIVKAGAGVIQSYEVVQKTVKSSGFLGIGGGTSTSSQTLIAQLPENARKAIASAFSYGESLILGIADYLNMNLEAVGAKLSQVSVDELISLRGLTGEDFTKALNNILSAVLDDATYAIFSNLEKFANFGEGMLETVIRVTDTNAKILQSLKNTTNKDLEDILYTTGVAIPKYVQGLVLGVKTLSTEVVSELEGIMYGGTEAAQGMYRYFSEQSVALAQAREILGDTAIDQIGGDLSKLTQPQLQTLKDAGAFFVEQVVGQVQDGVTASFASADIRLVSIEITEALATAAGGLDKFLEQANYFSENFLTEAERLVPVRKAVTAELERLGLGYVDTIDEFKAAVQALDLTKVADRQTLIDLYAVQQGFIELYGAAGDSSKAEGLRIQLLKLEGKTTEALNAQRQKEFETLSETEQSLQARIWLLEDEAAIRKLDISLLQAQGRSYEALIKTREDELLALTQEQKLKKLLIYQQEDVNKTLTLQIRLLKAVGLAQEAAAIERQQELNQYSAADQVYLNLIYTFEDAVAAGEALQKSFQSTISAIGSQIKQLQDYKKTLLGGDKSTLNTLQKYTNAKAEVERLSGIILSAGTSEKDRADAINSLTGASDQFLSLSRSLYSSSEVYTRDFNSITTLLDSVTRDLGTQQTDAEKQLTALQDSASFLKKIDQSTGDTATLLDRYLTNLQTFLTAAASAPSNIVSQIAPAIASAIASYSSITGTTPATPTGTAATSAQTVQDYAQIYNPTASGMAQDTATTAAFTPTAGTVEQITNADATNYIKQLYANVGRSDSGSYAYTQSGFDYWLNQLLANDSKPATAQMFNDSVRAYLLANPDTALAQHIRDYRAANPNLPAFASGADYLSRDMIAQVHQGERIISAPDNAEITRAFSNKDETNRELVQEIKKLNEKVSSLEKTVAEGAVLNVQATDRNTQEISRSVSDSTKTVAHTEAIRRRTNVV